ncbi:MAG: cytochrome c oxidase assembly protein [Actinomycetota bacterium]|nr:cytochrome c oxidase assembly protein [Actinomycetota bacterium]
MISALASTASFQDLLGWHPHYEVWAMMLAGLAIYALLVARWGESSVEPGEKPVSRLQVGCFLGGMSALWIGASWPIHDMAEQYLFSVHMFQHLIFSLVGAPLILLGIPHWMARRVLGPKPVMFIMKKLTRPIPALLLFNGYLVISHSPAFVDAVLVNHPLHFLAHAGLFFTAIIMWWPVFSPLPEIARISNPAQMLYLFGQTIVPTVPASFLTFGETPMYAFYIKAPRLFAGFSALADQRIAGLTMKLFGGFLLWGVIAVLFFRWSSKEEKGTPDEVEWQDLELKVNQSGQTGP